MDEVLSDLSQGRYKRIMIAQEDDTGKKNMNKESIQSTKGAA
jgi:hypothetical protein